MSKTSHTPGPWIVKRRFDVYEDTGKPGVGGTFVCSTRGNSPLPESINVVCEADAHLIAALPELLAAAIDVLELHEHEQDRPAVRRLRQAIAKATGKEASE